MNVDSIKNNFIAIRSVRWQFALQIFKHEYTFKQKIFGGGFDFLSWYGYYFMKDKTKTDYPHSPFLHILLYSGLFGLLIYILFFYQAFHHYLKHIKATIIIHFLLYCTFFYPF
ncbi:MAG: O-antigen ligase family protein [Bacteroidales bacterium]|nr:O-antigen ligase family protein [Bacteroidales bacterium]